MFVFFPLQVQGVRVRGRGRQEVLLSGGPRRLRKGASRSSGLGPDGISGAIVMSQQKTKLLKHQRNKQQKKSNFLLHVLDKFIENSSKLKKIIFQLRTLL